MPLRAYVDCHGCDAETVRLIGLAFELVVATLRPTPDYADPVREVIARKIVELAQAGERDPERLCEGVLKDLGPVVTASRPISPLDLPGP
jgi:hypothetical protein